MCCFLDNRVFLTNITPVIDQLSWGVEKLSTFVTLVTSCFFILTMRTLSRHKSVSEKELAIFTETLSHWLSIDHTIFFHMKENVLSDLSVPLCAGSSKMVKSNIKPFVNLRMDFKEMVTNFSWSFLLLQCFHLSCSTILISTTNIKSICPLKFFVSWVDITWKDTSDDISQMRHIVDVW